MSSGRAETIVEIGGDSGSITLQRRRGAGDRWEFSVITNEAALWDMLDEEPPPPEPVRWVSSWDEAVDLLNVYPWPQLFPLAVHPEIEGAVFAAIAGHPRGGAAQVARWRERLREP